MATTSKQTKLSPAMKGVMTEALKRPLHEYGNRTQIKALQTRGMVVRKYDKWILTDLGIETLGANKLEVAVRYAEFFLRDKRYQVRHNVMMIDKNYYDDGYTLRHEFFTRSFAETVNGIHDFQQRAIELARAEWRAGVAKAEIGLVG